VFANARRERGLGAKTIKPSTIRVHRVKRRWRVMGGGGCMVWMRWWRWWGRVSANVRQKRGLGAKKRETKHDGSISGAPCETTVEQDGGGGGVVQMRWWWWWGHAL